MCRQYITTGMNKKKNWLFMLLWLFVAATSRIQYFVFGGQSVIDTYAYFSYAMMRAEKQAPVFNSGLSYAFTKHLSRLLLFTGNLIDAVGIYQLLIQILWIVFLLAGISMLFGRIAGFVSSGILIVSPWILKSVFSVSPENYFMLHFSMLLVVLGYFHVRSVKGEWHKSVWSRLYLKAAGFFVGMLCIWNYLGWIFPLMMVYVLICHSIVLKDRIKQQRQQNELKEKKRIMGAGSQLFHLLIGWIVGIYATLMKYTGLTGNTLKEQLDWWFSQFKDFPGRCQDVSTIFSIWLTGAVLAGVLCQLLYHIVRPKKAEDLADEQKTEAMRDVKEVQEAENVRDAKEIQETKNVQDVKMMQEIETVQDAEATMGIEFMQVAEEVQNVESGQQSENGSKTQAEQNPDTEIYQKPEQKVAKEGRKVQFLENPLPVPKKHVRKDIGFDIEEVKMDFDIEINEGDDFDI